MADTTTVCSVDIEGGTLVGLTIKTMAGALSMGADAVIGFIIIFNVVRSIRHPASTGWTLIKTPLDAFLLALISFDFTQGLGTAMSARWVNLQKAFCSPYCTAQGSIQLMGEAGSGMVTLAIAVYTFIVIGLRVRVKSLWPTRLVLFFIALYVILFAAIGSAMHRTGDDRFDTPDPYWCWVGDKFEPEKIAGEYVWLWLGALASFLYIPLYFITNKRAGGDTLGGLHWKVLFYPLAYTVLVLPLSVTRWLGFQHHPTSTFTLFFFSTIYQLTGFVNVCLIFWMRRDTALLEPEYAEEDDDSSHREMAETALPDLRRERSFNIRQPKIEGDDLLPD